MSKNKGIRKNDLIRLLQSFLIIIAGFIFCMAYASKTNSEGFFTGYCVLYSLGVISYLMFLIIEGINKDNNE